MAEKSDQKNPIALREEEILAFWRENRIFEKSVETPAGKAPKGEFVFYDGPPFATGLPHYGHILPGTIKDVIPRFQTMRGLKVTRKWGWDCHGLPIENLIEKELGLKSKKDIEEMGVEKFNAAARASVLRYDADWKRIIPRTGRWVDMDNAYLTMNPPYMESVWWSFKTLFQKGLIYQGFKIMYLCPHCETTLANFEVSQGYKDITDISVFAKFELVDEPGTFLLAWTTTPWTLPGNVALAVKSDVDYVKAKKDGSVFILAKNLVQKVLKENFEIISEIKGKALIGKTYKPVFNYYKDAKLENKERGWKVYGADFVTTEDGTGIVHIAPAFGEDDYKLAQEQKLPFIQHVGTDGKFKKEVTDFAGQSVKPKSSEAEPVAHQKADVEIIKYLAAHQTLFAKEKLIHSYPHCWRCETPLLNYASSSWFLNVTKLKSRLIKENKKVSWLPEEMRDGRFGKWLEGAHDWAISRTRYWGSTLPVWKCEKCEQVEVVGSLEELKKHTSRGNTFFVMRHGESKNNTSNTISTEPTNLDPLTENGREQVRAAAAQFKKELKKLGKKAPDVIVASDFARTKETAEIIATELGMPAGSVVFDERIREFHLGVFNGKPLTEYHKYAETHDVYTNGPEGGEGRNAMHERAAAFLYETDKKYKGKTILVVSHQALVFAMAVAAAGARIKEDGDAYKSWFFKNAQMQQLPFAEIPHNRNYELDMHRPYIDEITFPCSCGGEMKKIPDVFDTWYESGSMPFAQNHFPFEGKSRQPKNFPAHFIAEGLDQTRGWFYTLAVLGAGLFGQVPYKQVVVNGLILAEDGRKMSKSLKNYPDIEETLNRFGADALRYFLMSSPAVKGEDLRFSEKGIDDVLKKLSQRLQNVYSFYEMYVGEKGSAQDAQKTSKNVLDIWILARLKELTLEVTAALEKYELDRASRPLLPFVDDLSTWYLRRSRERFKGANGEEDKAAALATTAFVLREYSKLLAPFMPFLAEDIYLKVKKTAGGTAESVHLESWPKQEKLSREDVRVIGEMARARNIVSLGLEARSKAGIKVRQPLASLASGIAFTEHYSSIIADEVNVKGVSYDKSLGDAVSLDVNLTAELKKEGFIRDLIRDIQDKRKEMNLTPEQKVVLTLTVQESDTATINEYKAMLIKTTGLRDIKLSSGDSLAISLS